jgi:hypothetical protein
MQQAMPQMNYYQPPMMSMDSTPMWGAYQPQVMPPDGQYMTPQYFQQPTMEMMAPIRIAMMQTEVLPSGEQMQKEVQFDVFIQEFSP